MVIRKAPGCHIAGHIRLRGSTSTETATPGGAGSGTQVSSAASTARRLRDLRRIWNLHLPARRSIGAAAGPETTTSRLAARRDRGRPGSFFRARRLVGGEQDLGELRERRIEKRLPEFQLSLHESRRIVRDRGSQGRVFRLERLDVHGARTFPAACAAGNLSDQLKRLFGGPEVGKIEDRVRRQDADRGDSRKVMSLRDHLRADEGLNPAAGHGSENAVGGAPAARDVGIEHGESRSRKQLREPLRGALGAGADRLEQRASARTAPFRDRAPRSAIVTDERSLAPMHDPRNAARVAAEIVPAGAAEQHRGVAPPRREQNRLLAARENFAQPVDERTRKQGTPLLFRQPGFFSKVDDLDGRQRSLLDPLGKLEQRETAFARGVKRLDRRRGGAQEKNGAVAPAPGSRRRPGRRIAAIRPACTTRRALRRSRTSRSTESARTRPSAGR